MRTVLQLVGTLLAASCFGGVVNADKATEQVSNFTLLDFDGKSHELYKLSDRKAIVLMTQGNGCPIVRLSMPGLRDIRDRYRAHGVEVLLINSNLQDTAQSIKAEAQEFEFNLPILIDGSQTVGEALGVNRTAEVFVIDPKSWKVVYHGPVDDRLGYEAQRPANQHYLADALDAILAGKPVAVANVMSPGCLISFPNRRHQ
jgi:peroxiredoxin